jgi:twitching motility protein PilT
MEQMLFGQILLNFHLITEPDLQRCLNIQRHQGVPQPLGEILVQEGLIDESILASILSVQKRNNDPALAKLGMTSHELAHRLQHARAEDFLAVARDIGASDLYLTSGKVPMVRQHGVLCDLPSPLLGPERCEQLIFALLSEEQKQRYRKEKRLDLCTTIPGIARIRMSLLHHHRGIGAVCRLLADEVRPLSTLGLPSVVQDLTDLKHGLVLITGPTGSGKTTTLAALVDEMNQRRKLHIITLEDPIETVFHSEKSLITQREINTHTPTFATGLRAALREDPDVIVVGELRDPETFQVALTAAETGHLVFGTLHTRSAHGTILRVVEQFPPAQRAHVRTMLAGALRGVICQELIPNIDRKGRSLATEVMIVNQAISNLIRENRSWQIPMVMQTNAARGMTLMDDSLAKLVRKQAITIEEALSRATDQSKFVVPA